MDAAELRAIQAPIKERYKSDPKAAVITLTARGSIENEGIACKVETGRAPAGAGLHPASGGFRLELFSRDTLLEGLGACCAGTPKYGGNRGGGAPETGRVAARSALRVTRPRAL